MTNFSQEHGRIQIAQKIVLDLQPAFAEALRRDGVDAIPEPLFKAMEEFGGEYRPEGIDPVRVVLTNAPLRTFALVATGSQLELHRGTVSYEGEGKLAIQEHMFRHRMRDPEFRPMIRAVRP